jgi:hypothetical protein
VGIIDVTAVPGALPAELTSTATRIACIADARLLSGYDDLLTAAGLRVRLSERHDPAILRMIDQIEARLTLGRMSARDRAEALGVDFDRVPPVLAAAREAVGRPLGYGLIVAEKPRTASA